MKNNYYDLYKVNGNSMNNTLLNRDILLVNKNLKIKRFDIVVMENGKQVVVKRVIRFPGETIKYKNNQLYINLTILSDQYQNRIAENVSSLKIDSNNYYIMGDNRERLTGGRIYGSISKNKIIGVVRNSIFLKLKELSNVLVLGNK